MGCAHAWRSGNSGHKPCVGVRAIRARHRLAIAASAAGLAASTGAAASGAAFVSGSRAGASMAMAVLTGAALLSYLGILFVVRARPTEAAVSDHD